MDYGDYDLQEDLIDVYNFKFFIWYIWICWKCPASSAMTKELLMTLKAPQIVRKPNSGEILCIVLKIATGTGVDDYTQ